LLGHRLKTDDTWQTVVVDSGRNGNEQPVSEGSEVLEF